MKSTEKCKLQGFDANARRLAKHIGLYTVCLKDSPYDVKMFHSHKNIMHPHSFENYKSHLKKENY